MNLLCINNPNTDPLLNLATEEYLLKFRSENFFMLWQNRPCVVIGKYQHPLMEVDFDYAQAQQIPILQRITGGGAVYHDLGNINFSFIENNERADFSIYTQRMAEALRSLGIPADYDARNNLFIHEYKISGSAQCVHKGRVLHHGTLLFSADLERLHAALTPPAAAPVFDRAIKSVRSRVTNISEYLPQTLSIEEFKKNILLYFLQSDTGNEPYQINARDIAVAEQVKTERYQALKSEHYAESLVSK